MKHITEMWGRIEAIAERDPRYKAYAYTFVLGALEETIGALPSPRHVTGRELLVGIKTAGAKQFGPMAKEVFNFWGVYRTEDFGNIVFNLVEEGLLGRTEEDSPADFVDVYDFKKVFEEDYYEE